MRFFLIAQWNLRNVEEYKKLEAKNLEQFQECSGNINPSMFWVVQKNPKGNIFSFWDKKHTF
jgi:hypothetical protein